MGSSQLFDSTGAARVRCDGERVGRFYACDTDTKLYKSLEVGQKVKLLVGRKPGEEVHFILELLGTSSLGTNG
jgi:hypothetical protein